MASRLASSALTFALLPATAAVGAQTALEDVVVTATGRQADAFETPLAIEVVTPARATPAAPPGAMFRGEPGMAVQSDGAWGQNPVLRGLKKESIVVLVDGMRLNSAQPQGALASFADIGLLERAEVVKGPSSVLYGTGAMGGVVHLITPEARFSTQAQGSGRVGLGIGTANSGALLLRRSNADHALVLGAAARDVDDYRSADGREPHTGYRSDSLLVKYRYRLSDAASLRLNLQRHADHDVWYPGSARTGGRPGGAGIPPLLGTVTIRSPEQRREAMEAGIDARIGPGQLAAEVYRQDVLRQIRAFSANLDRDYVRNDVVFATHGVRAKYTLPAGDRQILTFGAESWRMRADPERYIDNNAPRFDNRSRNDPFDRGSIRASGLFAQNEIDWGNTRVVAGARFDRVEGDARRKGAGAAAQTDDLEHADNTVSWSLGAIHAMTPTLSAYANLGRAWRAADLRERFEDAARGDGYYHTGNPQLEPERSTSLEVGLKGRGGSLAYRIAAFRTRIDDFIAGRVTGTTHPGTGLPVKRTQNLAQVVIYGLEGGASMPLGVFVADAGFTWLRGENRQDDEPLAQMPAPEMRVGIGQPAERGWFWHAQLRAAARQHRIATRFTAGTENETPGFVTADARLGWHFGKLAGLQSASAELVLTNLFDRRYHEHLTDGISGEELPAPGRGVALSLNGSF